MAWDEVGSIRGLQGPPGEKGDPGEQGEQGPPGEKGDPGEGSGDVLWSELNPVLAGKAEADHSHTPESLGAAPAADVAALQSARTTSTVTPSSGTTTLAAPTSPVAGQMHIFEILPTVSTTVTVSSLGPRADGVPESLTVEAGGVGLVGVRWSSSKSSWHVLTASVVV